MQELLGPGLVYLCKTAEDTAALVGLGFTAIMSEPSGKVEALKDRDVIVLADADVDVLALIKLTRKVRVLDLEGSVADFLQSDPASARLARAAAKAPLLSEDTNPIDAKTFVNMALDDGKARAEVERLARLDQVSYERKREISAAKLGFRCPVLDKLVEQARRRLKTAPPPVPPADVETLEKSAHDLIQCENVLERFADEIGKVIAGERNNVKMLFLIATSRVLPKGMHGAVKGPSAAGKSEIRTRVLEFFPPESVVAFTTLSEKALFYFEQDFPHKILSMGEATGSDEQRLQDYLLRELISEGRLRYPVVQKVNNELVTVVIEKNGPVVFLVTTTKNKLNPENETRMLSLEVNDSEDQTRAVLRTIARFAALGQNAAPINYEPWQNFQRWIENGECRVIVPFAETLAGLIPPKAVRLRRDVPQLLCAITVHH
jgi:hypothetical protein